MGRGREVAERISRRVRQMRLGEAKQLDTDALLERLRSSPSATERVKAALEEARARVGPGRPNRSDRMLRAKEVEERTGMSRTTVWRLERRGDFPERVRLTRSTVAWRESEVSAWIARRRTARSGA